MASFSHKLLKCSSFLSKRIINESSMRCNATRSIYFLSNSTNNKCCDTHLPLASSSYSTCTANNHRCRASSCFWQPQLNNTATHCPATRHVAGGVGTTTTMMAPPCRWQHQHHHLQQQVPPTTGGGGCRAASVLPLNRHQCCSSASQGWLLPLRPPTTPAAAYVNTSVLTRSFSTTSAAMDLKTLQIEKSKFSPPDDLGLKVPSTEVRRFMVDCLTAVGVTTPNATHMANVLVAADTRGHFSHGLNRLEMYVNDVRASICKGNAAPTIEKQSVSTALVVGNNGLGPVVGNFSMDLAIAKAKETGIGWVCARGSNHYGIAGWYAMRAADQGLLGMSFTNTSPLVAPTRAKKPALGTNPIALAAPAQGGDPFVLDMATCTVAVGKIEVSRRKGEPIPEGWALDDTGAVTTDASKAMVGALMPLGGSETNSGYKGYGLAMMVEIFCGLLSGGAYGPNVRRWMDTTKEADLGQCFVAIDPSFFAPGFPDRMQDMMDHCRGMDPATPGKPVLAHGDPERAHIKKVEAEAGITYHVNQITDSWKLASVLKVNPMAGV